RSRSVNNAETFWMLPGTFQIGLACTFKKGALFLFEAVRVAATVYPLPRHLKRHIKQEGEIRLHVWVNPFLKHCNALLAQLAAAALIGVTGVGETIAHHPGSRFQGRRDAGLKMLVAGGKYQQGFGTNV